MPTPTYMTDRKEAWVEHIAAAGVWHSTKTSRQELPGGEFLSEVSIYKTLMQLENEGRIKRIKQGVYVVPETEQT